MLVVRMVHTSTVKDWKVSYKSRINRKYILGGIVAEIPVLCYFQLTLQIHQKQFEVTVKTIYFYSVTDEYGAFSNFAQYPIRLKGVIWPTTEHYFQAMKMSDLKNQKKILKAKRAIDAARIGRNRKNKIRRNWESMKVNVMREAVTAKFTQHEELRDLLISTGNSKLVEHSAYDSFWGDGGNGNGKNMLGRILMDVRTHLLK